MRQVISNLLDFLHFYSTIGGQQREQCEFLLLRIRIFSKRSDGKRERRLLYRSRMLQCYSAPSVRNRYFVTGKWELREAFCYMLVSPRAPNGLECVVVVDECLTEGFFLLLLVRTRLWFNKVTCRLNAVRSDVCDPECIQISLATQTAQFQVAPVIDIKGELDLPRGRRLGYSAGTEEGILEQVENPHGVINRR